MEEVNRTYRDTLFKHITVYSDIFSYDNQLRSEGRAEGEAVGEARGRTEGEARGRTEGEAKSKISIALVMLAAGEPVEKIIKYTGLTREEVENLRTT